MSPELHAMLTAWLDGGTEDQKRHARARLAINDMPPSVPPRIQPRPEVRRMLAVVKWGLRSCLYSSTQGCGCSGAHCHHLGRVVTLPDCLTCLGTRKDGMRT